MRRSALLVAALIACGSTPSQDVPDASDAADASDGAQDAQPEVDVPDAPADVEPDVVDGFQCGTIVPTGSMATTYQIDARHDGIQPSDVLAVPLCKRWTAPFAGPISYPVVASGRVFVTVADVDAGSGTDVYALDETTGARLWGPVALGSQQAWSALAYDADRLFALDGRGMLTAFDPATGHEIWQVKTPASSVESPPSPWGGRLYFSGSPVYAFDEADGTLGWVSSSVQGGYRSSPAVDLGGVYVSYGCDQSYSFDPSTGALIWFHSGGTCSDGGLTPALHANLLFVRDYFAGSRVLMASSGVATAMFAPVDATPPPIPSFIGSDTLLRVLGGSIVAWNFNQQQSVWTFAGDGKLVTAPLVASSTVVVGSSTGTIYALDAATGALVSSDDVGSALQAPNEGGNAPLTGLAIADGRLFVPAHGALVAY